MIVKIEPRANGISHSDSAAPLEMASVVDGYARLDDLVSPSLSLSHVSTSVSFSEPRPSPTVIGLVYAADFPVTITHILSGWATIVVNGELVAATHSLVPNTLFRRGSFPAHCAPPLRHLEETHNVESHPVLAESRPLPALAEHAPRPILKQVALF